MNLNDFILSGGTVPLFEQWDLSCIKGVDAVDFLHAQTTADLKDLNTGEARLTARLDRAGRVHSFFYFIKGAEEHHILSPKELTEELVQELEKFIIMEDVQLSKSDSYTYFKFGRAALESKGSLVLFYGLPGKIEITEKNLAANYALKDLEPIRQLNGFPRWKIDVTREMLVNETILNELAVNYKKGCFLGQETAAKINNNRGAAYYPTLLKIEKNSLSVEIGLRDELLIDDRKVADVLGLIELENESYLLVRLKREERINNSTIKFEIKDNSVTAIVRYLPFCKPQTFQEYSQELFEEGGNAFRDGDELKAEKYLRAAIEFCEENEDAYESLGVMLGRQERYDEAISMMDKLSTVNPLSVMAHSNKSLYLMRQGKIEEAEKEKAEATFKSFQYYGKEAEKKKSEEEQLQKKSKDQEIREGMFLQVLEIDADDEIALSGLSEIRYAQNKLAEAYELSQRLLSLNNKHTGAYLIMGKVLLAQNKKSEARSHLGMGVDMAKKKGELRLANEMQALINKLES